MTTARELKDYIAMDSAFVEDGLLQKLGAAVKGAISGAKAGFKNGSSSVPGDGKAKGKGRYGLQHPDGTPCDAKKPESCPIMREQMKKAEENGGKSDDTPKADAVEKKADKADDLDKGGASFFPEDDDKKDAPDPKGVFSMKDGKKDDDEKKEEKSEEKLITLKQITPSGKKESLTDWTAKWDTAAKVCVQRNQALRKAIADGAGKDEIARMQKDVHDANVALSKIEEAIDAYHKKSYGDSKKASGESPKSGKPTSASAWGKKYIESVKAGKSPSPEAKAVRDALHESSMDGFSKKQAEAISLFLTKEGFMPKRVKTYQDEFDYDYYANYYDACFELDSEAEVPRLKKALQKMMKASGVHWGTEDDTTPEPIDIRPRKHAHADGTNYRARIWAEPYAM